MHARYTTDNYVPTNYSDRKHLLLYKLNLPEYCDKTYTSSDLYKRHMEITIDNLKEVSKICNDNGVVLAIENLKPIPTYLFQVMEDFNKLVSEIPNIGICIDTGHLWLSSQVYGFNYLDILTTLLQTGCVVSTHIHDNNTVKDSHSTIATGVIPLKDSVKKIVELSNAPLISEAKQDPLKNIKLLHKYSII